MTAHEILDMEQLAGQQQENIRKAKALGFDTAVLESTNQTILDMIAAAKEGEQAPSA